MPLSTLITHQDGPYRIVDLRETFRQNYFGPHLPPKIHGVIDGAAVQRELSKDPLPGIPLDTEDRHELRKLLQQAGCFHAEDSPSEDYAIKVFKRWRCFAQTTERYDRYTFDWDHTLSNFKIVLTPALGASLLFSKFGDKLFSKIAQRLGLNSQPLTVVEVQRPFMGEMAFGLMVGGALSIGLESFEEWGAHAPLVSLATSTWKPRIDLWAKSCSPLIRLIGASSTIHLKDFLNHSDYLMNTCVADGLESMEPSMRTETLRYLNGLKAHHVKPEPVFTDRYPDDRILHFDDYLPVLKNLSSSKKVDAYEVYQPHPTTKFDLHKIQPDGMFTGEYDAIMGALEELITVETEGSTSPALLSLADYLDDPRRLTPPNLRERHTLPEGVILTALAVQSPISEFLRNYQRPIQKAHDKIAGTRRVTDYRHMIRTRGAP